VLPELKDKLVGVQKNQYNFMVGGNQGFEGVDSGGLFDICWEHISVQNCLPE